MFWRHVLPLPPPFLPSSIRLPLVSVLLSLYSVIFLCWTYVCLLASLFLDVGLVIFAVVVLVIGHRTSGVICFLLCWATLPENAMIRSRSPRCRRWDTCAMTWVELWCFHYNMGLSLISPPFVETCTIFTSVYIMYVFVWFSISGMCRAHDCPALMFYPF